MRKVLLTGATGFIGRHCLRALVAAGGSFDEVHAVSTRGDACDSAREPAVDFNSAATKASVVRWHRANLLSNEDVQRVLAEVQPSHLLHLAWYAEPGKYWTSPVNEEWLRASERLLREFVERGGERVVVAGTCAEYDWNDGGYCSERATRLAPATLYGKCKDALRNALEELARDTGLSAAWGRIFFLYGTHEHPQRLVASVIRSLLREEVARCTHGEQLRDFLYVQDVADAFVALLESDVRGAVNIASGEVVNLKTVIERIAEKLDRPHLIRLGALPAPAGEPKLLAADVSRLRDEVRWSPRYTLDAGLEATINWWRAQPDSVA
ncbi:MAG TPA: NAD(P)-dependent oxidoreductase [Pyrinomonadaceae bacterium]|jgi:nucleoside-diphosphate-sugar epimerase